MRLPLVSRKKYNLALENFKAAMASRKALAEEYTKLQEKEQLRNVAFQQMQDANREAGNRVELQDAKVLEMKKEIANLKRLLTKNGIPYKKENK